MKNIKQQGFTLIELLTVMAIILILIVGIALLLMDEPISRSRDARRMGEMKQIQKALEMYYTANFEYPLIIIKEDKEGTHATSCFAKDGEDHWDSFAQLIGLDNTFRDPINETTDLCYYYTNVQKEVIEHGDDSGSAEDLSLFCGDKEVREFKYILYFGIESDVKIPEGFKSLTGGDWEYDRLCLTNQF